MFPRVMGSHWARETNWAFTPVPEKNPMKLHSAHSKEIWKHFTSLFATTPCLSFSPPSHFLLLCSLPLSVSPVPLIHGMQHWHIHNQTDLTLHILPQWERRRLRQELYTRPSLLISRSQHQTPPPSISPSLSGLCSLWLPFHLSLFLSIFPHFSPYRLVLHHASSPILFLSFPLVSPVLA